MGGVPRTVKRNLEQPRKKKEGGEERVGVKGKEKRSRRSGSLFPAVQVVLGRLEKFRVGAPAVGRFDVICWDEGPRQGRYEAVTQHTRRRAIPKRKVQAAQPPDHRRTQTQTQNDARNTESAQQEETAQAKLPSFTPGKAALFNRLLLSPQRCSHRKSFVFGLATTTTSSTHPLRHLRGDSLRPVQASGEERADPQLGEPRLPRAVERVHRPLGSGTLTPWTWPSADWHVIAMQIPS